MAMPFSRLPTPLAPLAIFEMMKFAVKSITAIAAAATARANNLPALPFFTARRKAKKLRTRRRCG